MTRALGELTRAWGWGNQGLWLGGDSVMDDLEFFTKNNIVWCLSVCSKVPSPRVHAHLSRHLRIDVIDVVQTDLSVRTGLPSGIVCTSCQEGVGWARGGFIYSAAFSFAEDWGFND